VNVAPDFVEPVIGWRAWHAADDGLRARLSSVVYKTTWPARWPLVAECRRSKIPVWPFNRNAHDEAPHTGCACGIHAATMITVRSYLPNHLSMADTVPVIGRVRLWGVVHEYDRGWRASHAYPECLYLPIVELDPERAARLVDDLGVYGVPVRAIGAATIDEVIDEIKALAA
jgi:hypothetical protein